MTRPDAANRLRVSILLLAALLLAGYAQASDTETQRALFIEVYADAELGVWSGVESLSATEKQLLRGYVLWPDLRAAYLRRKLSRTPTAEIEAFLQQYGALRPGRDLRYRYALHLAKNGNLEGFQRIYERFYQGQEIARLDCLSLQADLEAGHEKRMAGRAMQLWLVGRSQVSECDPVFDYLKQQQKLGTAEHHARFQLAIEARSFSLARWLAKKLDKQYQDEATEWIAAHANPEDFLNNHRRHGDSETAHKQLAYAAERLTYRDPELARAAWQRVSRPPHRSLDCP